MKVLMQRKYGGPELLALEEVDRPSPKAGEILIRVKAASLNAADWHQMRGDPYFFRLFMGGLSKPRPQVLGRDVAGVIEAIGSGVEGFEVGDEVFGEIEFNHGGSYAEYITTPADSVLLKPANLTFGEAAAMPLAGITAIQTLRNHGQLAPGQSVLINGAAGGVGTFLIQIAKSIGAEVTAVCSERNHAQAIELGADHVIDYRKENFTELDKSYDLIVAVNGYHPIGAYKRSLNPGGRYVLVGGTNAQLFQGMLLGPFVFMGSGKTMEICNAKANVTDLQSLKDLAESGQIVPVIDRTYALVDIQEGLEYLETGHARGKIVIEMG
ncbi:NAD(P)-dependent alcohol dehydrogenase [Pontibacter sp. G13]|uniref:NAD(P)-dependent alcohol dehydrogenase n=1 Tax=Pontibacter sp. G13 TaxID=3074898 RepID=UPI00288AE7DF|nr:NAD(P)-dependent alcohol dehydrogenase [Pontibacter sp. G13]WNJ20267.1 NAD(P)-dependent alcohol dehydrogenase [Pontibacter sp. G13]